MMPQAEEQVLATTVRDLLSVLCNATFDLSGTHLTTLKRGLEGLREQIRPGLQPSGFNAADPNLRQKRQAPSGQAFRSVQAKTKGKRHQPSPCTCPWAPPSPTRNHHHHLPTASPTQLSTPYTGPSWDPCS